MASRMFGVSGGETFMRNCTIVALSLDCKNRAIFFQDSDSCKSLAPVHILWVVIATTTAPNNVTAVVRLLIGGTNRSAQALAEALDVHPSTMSRRLKPTSTTAWKAWEIEAAARFFGVPLSTFFMDPSDVYRTLGLDLEGRPLARSEDSLCELGVFQPELFDPEPAMELVVDLREPAVALEPEHLVDAA